MTTKENLFLVYLFISGGTEVTDQNKLRLTKLDETTLCSPERLN